MIASITPRSDVVRFLVFVSVIILSFSSIFAGKASQWNESLVKHRTFPTEWKMHNGDILSLVRKTLDSPGRIVTQSGETIVEFEPRQIVRQMVQSADKSKILLSLYSYSVNSDASRVSYDYQTLGVLLHRKGMWHFVRMMPPDRFEQGQLRKIGAVSNDGMRALLLVAYRSAATPPYSMVERWETRKLNNGSVISTGLRID